MAKNKLKKKQQAELDARIQNAIRGWQIPVMEISKISRAGEAAYMNGQSVEDAVAKVLNEVATPSQTPLAH